MKVILDLLSSMIERLGTVVAGICLIVGGVVWILPYFGIPAYIAQGFGMMGLGIAVIAFGKKAKKATDIYVASEAEKRITDPNLPTGSVVPSIQREIDKQQITTAAPPGAKP